MFNLSMRSSIRTRAMGVTEATDAPMIYSGLHKEIRCRVLKICIFRLTGGLAHRRKKDRHCLGLDRQDNKFPSAVPRCPVDHWQKH